MPKIPADKTLDVALAAIRGAGMTPIEIVLEGRHRLALSPLTLALVLTGAPHDTRYRGVPIRDGNRSYILVNLRGVGDLEAPFNARDFVRWFPVLPEPPPAPLANTRRAQVA